MEKVLERSEVKKENTWDVESIYQNVEDWQKDYTECRKEITYLEGQKEEFLKNAKNFKEFILLSDKVERQLEKIYVYANLKNNEDMANTKYQELLGKGSNLYQEYSEKTNFVVPLILKEDKKKIESFIESEEELPPFCHTIEDILRYQGHNLSEVEEKVIAAYNTVLSSASKTADMLMDADMRFGNILDEEENEVELTQSNYGIYIRSNDRRVRKDAFEKIHQVFGSFQNTLTTTLESTVKCNSTTARLKNFKSSLELSLFENNIPESLYHNLISVVHNNLDPLYKYFNIKKKKLGLKEFHLYDGYVSTVTDITKKYSFEDGKKLVLDALSVLGEDYIETLKKAFSERWIDVYPNRGKTSGAYSSGTYDTKPFVLLNYTGDYNDVSTLAHELGHSMHSYLSNTHNEHTNASYPIFLAEIASTVNELLLSYYMEHHANAKEEKLAILNERLDTFKATIYRQTMFAEFELYMHEAVDKGEVLTAEKLCDKYYELNKLYFGKNVVVDSDIRHEWLRIPHFYRPFYVYQYATGLSIASYIAKNILEEKEGFRDKYLEFLSSGGKDNPLEILKIIDVDLTDTKVLEESLTMFKETVDAFEQLQS